MLLKSHKQFNNIVIVNFQNFILIILTLYPILLLKSQKKNNLSSMLFRINRACNNRMYFIIRKLLKVSTRFFEHCVL